MYENTILVTGGCGFIGSNFLNCMTEKYPTTLFVNLDKLDYCGREKNVIPRSNYTFIKGDILDGYKVMCILNQYNIKQVVHFAAYSHVDNSFDHSLEFTKNNVMGTHQLLEACRMWGRIERFVHVSTDEVYGSVENGTSKEGSILAPTNPYSASKACAEMICHAYIKAYNFPIIITRGNNVYGPRQYPEKLIPKFVMLAAEGKQFTVHGEGKNSRHFIYVDDVVRAFETILLKGKIGEIYNIGTDDEISVIDLCDLLYREFWTRYKYTDVIDSRDVPPYIKFTKDRPFNDFRYPIDTSKLHDLGWVQTESFQDGLGKTIQWYLDNLDYF